MIFELASFFLAIFAFGYGAKGLFHKKKPLYFQLLVCAAGCLALEQLSYVVNVWCHVTETVSIGMLGIFGCCFFLLSANFGTLDKIVDDGKNTKKARWGALMAPALMFFLMIGTFWSWKDRTMFGAVAWVCMLLPALPASYYNLKHVLLPTDDFGFLRATRGCNAIALVFYAVTAVYVIVSSFAGPILCGILSLVMSLTVLGLTLFAVKGARQWGISA